jgi:two-component system, chemotaxis family, protein-glutamate methylesterase/glutaminase
MASSRPRRVLIVDDSAVMRSLLRSVIASAPTLEVAGAAVDGEAALAAVESLRPDVVLLDVEMPKMDGLATLRMLRARGCQMPVIMCSSLTQRGARVTIEALAGGASDYVTKPAGQVDREGALSTLAQDLLPKIHALTGAGITKTLPAGREAFPTPLQVPASLRAVAITPRVLVVGVSTGGPAALDVLLPALPECFPLPVLVVQHMPELFTGLMADRLDERCPLRVREATEGDVVRPGVIWLARGDWHMEIRAVSSAGSFPTLHLAQGALENHCRPSVDVLFRSAAAVYGSGVLAVVLTGMGSDGLAGSRIVRSRGGAVLVQDQASSAVWGMPAAIAHAGIAHRVLPLDAIAPEILRITSRAASFAAPAMRNGAV